MKKNILNKKYNSGPTKLCPICAKFIPINTNGCLLPHKNILDTEYCKGVDLIAKSFDPNK